MKKHEKTCKWPNGQYWPNGLANGDQWSRCVRKWLRSHGLALGSTLETAASPHVRTRLGGQPAVFSRVCGSILVHGSFWLINGWSLGHEAMWLSASRYIQIYPDIWISRYIQIQHQDHQAWPTATRQLFWAPAMMSEKLNLTIHHPSFEKIWHDGVVMPQICSNANSSYRTESWVPSFDQYFTMHHKS